MSLEPRTMALTGQPRCTKASAMCPPTKPVAPVMR